MIKVIEGGYCIGCGACAVAAPKSFNMKFDELGHIVAEMTGSIPETDLIAASAVCPFANADDNEDSISERQYPTAVGKSAGLGRFQACYAGHVERQPFRSSGSSGGYLSWVLARLIELDEIDAVAHVKTAGVTAGSGADNRLFAYGLSGSEEEVLQNAKSRYYPVQMDEVVELIRQTPGRYAITGVPCFIKAIRLLQARDPILKERIKFCIGLVCGHLKSRAFADLIAWQNGIEPGNLAEIDFRHKLGDRPASSYAARVIGASETGIVERVKPMSDIMGGDWGVGYFKYRACGFCDDVMAETADVAVGDAWLPRYTADGKGSNIVVVRHARIHELTEAGIASGELALASVDAETVTISQEAGLRDRRSGLAYRLFKARRSGNWAPKKRVKENEFSTDRWFRRQQDLRDELAEMSHLAFADAVKLDNLKVFRAQIVPLLETYYRHQKSSRERMRRICRRILHRFRKAVGLGNDKRYLR